MHLRGFHLYGIGKSMDLGSHTTGTESDLYMSLIVLEQIIILRATVCPATCQMGIIITTW